MHNKLKKFSFFISKNLKDEEADKKVKDKLVKYLYKKEVGSIDKPHKNKVRSSHDDYLLEKHHNRNVDESRHKHRKKSIESVKKQKKNLLTKQYTSETELYYISPEEVKKHRNNKSHGSPVNNSETKRKHVNHNYTEHDHETGKIKQNKEPIELQHHLAKLIKEYKHQEKKIDKEDYQWLTKKEIFKLITNSKCLSKHDSTCLKDFFVFNNQEPVYVKPEGHIEKNRHKRDKIPVVKDLDDSTNVIPSKKSSKNHHRSRSRSEMLRHFSDVDTVMLPEQKTKRRKVIKEESHFKFEDLPNDQKEAHIPKHTSKKKEIENVTTCEVEEKVSKRSSRSTSQSAKSKNRDIRKKQPVESTNVSSKEQSKEKMERENRVNPIRHRFCLVKNTFSVVEIPSKHPPNYIFGKKKKSKAFKKYYKYDNVEEESEIKTETYQTFSDSNRMYQDLSEQSFEAKGKTRHKNKTKKDQLSPAHSDRELKAETHVSAVIIKEDDIEEDLPKNSQSSDRKNKKSKFIIRKSKIPILSSSNKIANSPKETSALSKTYKQKIIEAISSPRSNQEKQIKESHSDKSNSKPFGNKSNIVTKKPEKPCRESMKMKSSSTKPVQDKNIKSIKDKKSDFSKENNEKGFKEKASSNSQSNREKTEVGRPGFCKSSNQKAVQSTKELSKPSKIPSFRQKPDKTDLKKAKEISKYESKMSMNIHKQIKKTNVNKETFQKSDKIKPNINGNVASPVYRRRFTDSSVTNSQKGEKSSVKSQGGASSVWSKSSKKSNKTSLTSKSDTKLQEDKNESKTVRKVNNFERSSTKGSFSNSTFGDKSFDSSSRATSFFLTKAYKDDDKLSRCERQKMYSDSLRRKTQKLPPQVLEVRYLTVTQDDENPLFMEESGLKLQEYESCVLHSENVEQINNHSESVASIEVKQPDLMPKTAVAIQSSPSESNIQTIEVVGEIEITKDKKEFYENDLPRPTIEIVENEKFNELFQLPIDKALNEILHENYNFLKKDFSYALESDKSFSSDDLSSLNELVVLDKKFDDWYDFRIASERSLSEISCDKIYEGCKDNELNIESEDRIVDSCSAPGSEESGYATNKSRSISRSFFERPDIKALLKPSSDGKTSLDSAYCLDIQIEDNNSSNCGIDIRSIESKSQQTIIECSQKSIQIKMSQEEILEQINFSEECGTKGEQEGDQADVDCEEKKKQIETDINFEKQELDEEQNCISNVVDELIPKKECIEATQEVPKSFTECKTIIVKYSDEKNCTNGQVKVKKRRSLKKMMPKMSFLSCIITCIPKK